MSVHDAVRGTAVTATLRMSVFALYGLVILTQDIMQFEGRQDAALWAVEILLWVVLLADYLRGIRQAADRRRYLLRNLGYPVFLATGLLIPFDNPWVVALPLIVGYTLQLRSLAAGHAFGFSFGLIGFIMLTATLGMYVAEQQEEESDLRDVGSVLNWLVVTLFRIRGAQAGRPVSDEGQALAFVVGLVALVAAGLFTAQIVTWVVGGAEVKEDPAADVPVEPPVATAQDIAALRADIAALAARLDAELPDAGPQTQNRP